MASNWIGKAGAGCAFAQGLGVGVGVGVGTCACDGVKRDLGSPLGRQIRLPSVRAMASLRSLGRLLMPRACTCVKKKSLSPSAWPNWASGSRVDWVTVAQVPALRVRTVPRPSQLL
jgi:hypothetical protein